MRRYHHNMTNEVITFRTWALMVDSVDESDFKWLKAFDIPIRIDRPEHTFDVSTGASKTIYGKPTYTLDTTTDKQRDMVVLKYGNQALLIQEDHVLPGSISTCTLEGIKW